MAFVASYWYADYSFSDNNRNKANMSFRMPANLTLIEAQGTAEALRDALVPLVDARLDSYDLSQEWVNDSTAAIPSSSEVERKLSLTFSDAQGYAKIVVEVPSPVFSIEQFGTDKVDPANPLVAALVDAITNGGLGGGNSPVAFGGQDIVKLFSVPRIVHRTRKGRA